jgi:hypothetical protein
MLGYDRGMAMANDPTIPVRVGDALGWEVLGRHLKPLIPGLEPGIDSRDIADVIMLFPLNVWRTI